MPYFTIPTIREAIEHLQNFSGNWLIPAFVLAANDVGTDEFVDMARRLGTDHFLNRYFNGSRLGIPPYPTGNNLLRPRLKDVTWRKGPFAYDHMIRQDTKMWANLYSSRGYREMRLEGIIEGERSIVRVTDDFRGRFEQQIPGTFRFENFLVWLYAFEGVPDGVESWDDLFRHLLESELELEEFRPSYESRFRLSEPRLAWPELAASRPSNSEYLEELAPRLFAHLSEDDTAEDAEPQDNGQALPPLEEDDPVLAEVRSVIDAGHSLAFLLAGPPGTGKTRYARQLAHALTEGNDARVLYLQFHPAMAYDDFVEGFRPVVSQTGSGVKYELGDRLFLEFARRAAKNTGDVYVAVIDELNRGDVARILGEFLTYLEPDYRGREFTLSLSGKPFAVPRNLILLATANPFDRSVTDLDDALLRRFWVIELEPNASVLRTTLTDAQVDPSLINRTVHLFDILNGAFPTGFGHTSFLMVRAPEDLVGVWSGRIRLALHRAFLHDQDTLSSKIAEIEKLLEFPEPGDETDETEGE